MSKVKARIAVTTKAAAYNIRYERRLERFAWYIDCRDCSNTAVNGLPMTCNAEKLRQNFSVKGWKISNKHRPICPDCQNSHHKLRYIPESTSQTFL